MQIKIEPYNKEWDGQFQTIKDELVQLLGDLSSQIEHFGSTSVPGLAAKPVIDILVGLEDEKYFDLAVGRILKNPRYLYYESFNQYMPNRRLFVKIKDTVDPNDFEQIYSNLEDIPHDKINRSRISHIHIWKYNTTDWFRHIAFREYLKTHDEVRLKYENIKKALSARSWKHGMEYNDGKNKFIKEEEQKALQWYLKKE